MMRDQTSEPVLPDASSTTVEVFAPSPASLTCVMSQRVSAISLDDLTAAAPTPGVVREIAFDTGRASLMRARAEPHAVSGWHHHGDREVLGYVVRGAARFEFGPAGSDSTDVDEGGLFHVPAGLIHRDVNPLDAAQEIILAAVGGGPLVFNVDGPAPSGASE